MATLDETRSDFPVHSSEPADIDNEEEDSYADDCSEDYNSDFDGDEQTSTRSHIATPPPPSDAAAAADTARREAAVAQVDSVPTLDMPAAELTAVTSTPAVFAKPRQSPPSRLPVRVTAVRPVAPPTFAPAASSSAPASRLSSKPPAMAASDASATVAVSKPISAHIDGRAVPTAPLASVASKPKATSFSAPNSKPPSRSTHKASTSTAAAPSSSASSSSSTAASFAAFKPAARTAAFVKPNQPASTSTSSSPSPSHRPSKPSFDFSTTNKSSTHPSTTTTDAAIEASSHFSLHSKATPRLAQLQREAHWDPSPFIPPIVPQFTTQTNATRPLLDVKQSAWQLQQARRLPTAPNVLLRKPRSEVATRMSDVVMRTRQLRRRTKDTVETRDGGLSKDKGNKAGRTAEEKVQKGRAADVHDDDDEEVDGDVPSLQLAIGERVEQRSERRVRHNSPLAGSRVTNGR